MSVKQTTGKVLVHCFAGCPQDEVIGCLRTAGLWAEESTPFVSPPHLHVVTRYPYYDASGRLIATHIRKDLGLGKKTMPWELPNGHASTNGGVNPAELPLYGLPVVLERTGKAVVLVEGEKAADAALAEGLVAVSLSGGANQPDFGHALEALRDRHVILWPDNDEPGRELMRRVESKLTGVASRVQWLNVPGLAEKGDAADYFAADRTVSELRSYISDQLEVLSSTRVERRFRLLTAAELKNRPDPEWIVEGIIQRDTLVLIVGAQETYKSFIALDMAMSVAEGQSWHGHAARIGPTVYISAEGGSGLGLRVQAWETVRGIDCTSCFFLSDQAPQFLDGRRDGDVEELLLSLSDLDSPPALIIVDTLARVMVGHDENSAEDMGVLVATADRIRRETGATIGLVHHNNKLGSARGSTALTGAVHTIIECSRETNSKIVAVKCGKQKDADHFETMLLESRVVELGDNEKTGQQRTSLVLNRRSMSLDVMPASVQLKEISLRYLMALIDLKIANYAKWRDAIGAPNTTFRRTRNELINEGYVKHLSDGNYQPTEQGMACGASRAKQGPRPYGPWGQEEGHHAPYVVEGAWPLAVAPRPGQGSVALEPGEEPWV